MGVARYKQAASEFTLALNAISGKGVAPPLTLELVLETAEDVIRRFGPAKANVVDVASALGVSHAAIYRYVETKAQLRDLVLRRWLETTMPPLRAIASSSGPAPRRLKKFFDTRIAVKRQLAAEDPELFAAYHTLGADARSATANHIQELLDLIATIIRDGVAQGTFRKVDPVSSSRALLFATSRFHHPAHAAEWAYNQNSDAIYEDVWRMLMDGLSPSR